MWEPKGVLQRFRPAPVLLDVFWQVHPVPVLHISGAVQGLRFFSSSLWEICFTTRIPIITRNTTTETNYRKWRNFYQVSKTSKSAGVETEIQAKSCFPLSISVTLRRNETWRLSVLQTAEGKNSNCPSVGGSDQLWLCSYKSFSFNCLFIKSFYCLCEVGFLHFPHTAKHKLLILDWL